MIEKRENHLKDSEMSEQPETQNERRMINPCWPPPARKPVKVIFEVENLAGCRVDVNIHMSEMEPAFYPPGPPYYNTMGEGAEVKPPQDVTRGCDEKPERTE